MVSRPGKEPTISRACLNTQNFSTENIQSQVGRLLTWPSCLEARSTSLPFSAMTSDPLAHRGGTVSAKCPGSDSENHNQRYFDQFDQGQKTPLSPSTPQGPTEAQNFAGISLGSELHESKIFSKSGSRTNSCFGILFEGILRKLFRLVG